MKQIGWRIVPIVLFGILCLFFWRGLSLNPHELPSVQIGNVVAEFTLPELQDPNLLFRSTQIRNEVTLLNVWASWCAACAEEHIFLLELARKGVPIYGLNYKDKPESARKWLVELGNPYKQVAQDTEGLAAFELGVYGAPETFVIDKKGIIRYRHAGIMNQELWQNEILPLMRQLELQA
jgi:cytochrome c biogenesis protein CcmG, thiol:disulfide interchange protein DsbE